MKTLFFIGVMSVIGFGLVGNGSRGVSTAEATPEMVPVVSTNEGGCWDKCKKCEEQCRSKSGDAKRSCDDACWTTNDSCCSGVGGKGVYKMCGCKDK